MFNCVHFYKQKKNDEHQHNPRQANAVMKRRLPALSAGTRVSFAGNCRKQKPQIDQPG